jgi:hypothetical protein
VTGGHIERIQTGIHGVAALPVHRQQKRHRRRRHEHAHGAAVVVGAQSPVGARRPQRVAWRHAQRCDRLFVPAQARRDVSERSHAVVTAHRRRREKKLQKKYKIF